METNLQERPPAPVAEHSPIPSPASRRRVIAILAVVAVLIVAGIYEFASLPKDEPQAATGSTFDPAGRWYYLDAESFTVSTIDLDPSGSLLADIYWGDEEKTVTHHGSWVYEDGVVQIAIDYGIFENWDIARDSQGNEILTYRDSSAPDKTVSMPGTIAYRSQELMEKNR